MNSSYIILFDQDIRHYRQSLYKYFMKRLSEHGYTLLVVYDINLTKVDDSNDIFIGINYSFQAFKKIIQKYNPKAIIQFVWLKYKFLIPFMIWAKFNNIKIILWSHGTNINTKPNRLLNQVYYLRQRLSNAFILYTENQEKYFLKSTNGKRFIARNTLNFIDFIIPNKSKILLKEKYNLQDKIVLLSVGRMNDNKRNYKDLIELSGYLPENYNIIVIGPGITSEQKKELISSEMIDCLGPIYDNKIINEYYKLSDIFFMPGMIGLAINHAFYFSKPVIYKKMVGNPPEDFYFKEGYNGYSYQDGGIEDVSKKIIKLCSNKRLYNSFSSCAKQTINSEASVEKMYNGFLQAIKYTSTKTLNPIN